jgi:hypothetical protein
MFLIGFEHAPEFRGNALRKTDTPRVGKEIKRAENVISRQIPITLLRLPRGLLAPDARLVCHTLRRVGHSLGEVRREQGCQGPGKDSEPESPFVGQRFVTDF